MVSVTKWEQVGVTGVDAGMILITDPCYVIRDPDDTKYEPFTDWDEFIAKGLEGELSPAAKQLRNQFGSECGVAISRFGGDGVYSVYIQRGANGKVLAAQIRFDDRDP